MIMVRSKDQWDVVEDILATYKVNRVGIYLFEKSNASPSISVTVDTSIKLRIKSREGRRVLREARIGISGTRAYLQGLMPRIMDYVRDHELDHDLITITAEVGIIRDYLPTPRIDGTTIEEAAGRIRELVGNIGNDDMVIIHLFDEEPDWEDVTDMDYLFTDGQVGFKEGEDFYASIYGGYGRRYNAEYPVRVDGTWLISTNISNEKEGFHVMVHAPRRNWKTIINLFRDVAPSDRLFFVDEDRDCVLSV